MQTAGDPAFARSKPVCLLHAARGQSPLAMTVQNKTSSPAGSAGGTDAAIRTREQRPRWLLAWALGTVSWAAMLYTPWKAVPFYPVDFNESIAVMIGHDSFMSRAAGLFHTYVVGHGRLNGPASLYVTAQWELFGWGSRGWQLFAFCMMCLIVTFAFLVLRRLGATYFGAAAGATLFVPSLAIVGLWTAELHYPDPPSLPFLFGAIACATGYSRTTRWGLTAAGILLLSLLAAACKETVIAALPFTIFVAISYRGDDRWEWPAINRRNIALVLAGAALAVAFALAAVIVRRSAPAGDYVGHYGRGMELGEYAALVQGMFLPRAGLLAATLFMGSLALGWWLRLRRGHPPRSLALGIAVAASLPLLGTLAYLPWYYFRPDYAAPFLFGSAALVAFSAPRRPRSRWEAALAGIWVVGIGASLVLASRTAHHTAGHLFALRGVLGEISGGLADQMRRGGAYQIRFLVDTTDRQAVWFAPKIQEHAALMANHALPDTSLVHCSRARSALDDHGSAPAFHIALPSDCEGLLGSLPPGRVVQRSYSYVSLRGFRVDRDTLRSYVWAPSPVGSAVPR